MKSMKDTKTYSGSSVGFFLVLHVVLGGGQLWFQLSALFCKLLQLFLDLSLSCPQVLYCFLAREGFHEGGMAIINYVQYMYNKC